MKKNTKIINDNKKELNSIVSQVYKNIFKLDTKLLQEHEFQCYKELVKRKDFCDLDNLKIKYCILQDELIKRGVNI